MAIPSYKEREKRRREREILLSARRLIQESGFAGLNMDSLADAVGISKPTLYQHFKSKEDLIGHVLIDGLQEIEDYLLSTSEASPLERLKTVLRLILVSRYAADGLLADFETELIATTFHTHADVAAVKKRIMTEINCVVDHGKACGEIIATVPTPLVGCLLFKLIGLPASVQASLSPDAATPIESEALAQLIESVIDVFVRSVAQIKSTID